MNGKKFAVAVSMKSRWLIYISLGTDTIIAVTKFVVAGFTHSSAMLSEGIHSVIDALSQVLLLWGLIVSRKRADYSRPFGYGRELYFWSFMVSLIIFILGGCISFYEGLVKVKSPGVDGNGMWSYIVLAVAFLFTAVSGCASFSVFNKQRGDTPFWEAVKKSKDPSTFIILLGDMGDLAGLIIAFAGIYLGRLLGNVYYDGIASMAIGVILVLISFILVRESRSLLMGEPVSKKTIREIVALAEADDAILKVKRKLSIYLAPEEIVLQLTATFKKGLTTEQITAAIGDVSKSIQKKFPLVKQIFIEPVP